MKTIATLLAFALFMVSSAYAASELYLKVNRAGRYTVTIDDNTMSTRNGIFRFHDLNPGTYTLRVTRNEFFNTVVYERPVQLQNGIRTVAELDNNFNLQIIQQLPYQQSQWYLDQVYSGGGGNPNYPNYPNYPPLCPKHQRPGCWHPLPGGPNWDPNCPPNGQPNYPPTGYPGPGPNPYPYPGPGYPNGGYPIGNVMDNTTFQQLKTTMKNMPFDDNKLQVVKTALKNSWISTAQVGELMSLFSFDSKKLELAKYAYDKTTDQQNYFLLYDDFDFNSSATELDKYIATR